MTYGQLPERPKSGVSLYCPVCDEHFSAHRGDYFWAEPDQPIVCGRKRAAWESDGTKLPTVRCGESLYLVQREHRPRQQQITPADAEEKGARP